LHTPQEAKDFEERQGRTFECIRTTISITGELLRVLSETPKAWRELDEKHGNIFLDLDEDSFSRLDAINASCKKLEANKRKLELLRERCKDMKNEVSTNHSG
jgi:hypothetical protein